VAGKEVQARGQRDSLLNSNVYYRIHLPTFFLLRFSPDLAVASYLRFL
jgi:hypothetical protein